MEQTLLVLLASGFPSRSFFLGFWLRSEGIERAEGVLPNERIIQWRRRGCHLWKKMDARFDSRLDQAMKTKSLALLSCFALISFVVLGTASAADTKGAIERSLRELDAQWSAAAGAKDLDKTVSYYSDDAIVPPPNASSATTKEAIRSAWKELLTSPGAGTSWKATKVEVAKSGDLACVSGTYEDTITDAGGKPTKDSGKYVEIFKKQADGTWKAILDIWNSDLPASPPAEKR